MEIRAMAQEAFPPQLLEIPEPPKTLYARGSWPPEDTKYLAVVGSRALTPYGRAVSDSLIKGLAGYPITIVSGLALGADAAAHQAALDAKLHTIAVLGSGIDDASLYPRANVALAQAILSSGGLLLSEREAGYKAQAFDFPKRNRIVAGLAHAVLIIEAGEKSGTLITARLAGEYNRDLMCIPHRINDQNGYGAHLFLRLGAALVTEPAHILEVLQLPETPPIRLLSLRKEEQALYDLLEKPLPKDRLIRASRLPESDALSALVALELKGVLQQDLGVWKRV
jgi:DNA processing protein